MAKTFIDHFTDYAISKELICPEDVIYIKNRLMDLIGCDGDPDSLPEAEECGNIQEILDGLLCLALDTGKLASDTIANKDLFDTAIMGLVTDRPGIINEKFLTLYNESPKQATDWFYKYSCDVNYIRKERIKKDRKWTVPSEYGEIDITINLSKPEKDPRDIAAAKNAINSSYPKCQLCIENVGYKGRLDHPARENLRVIPLKIDGADWSFQYSPYVYYNEHCILFNNNHIPMAINEGSFRRLFSFIEQFPHYFIGSNADLPIVGGSILTHDHFQGGCYEFAMERAEIEESFTIPGFDDLNLGIVKWPLSVIRIQGKAPERIVALAGKILDSWRNYSDETVGVFSHSGDEPHNTITPIARKRGELFELDLALRNNRTSEEYPMGIFHPHSQYHHIKKENIGLIEVMGLAVLPARLAKEMDILAEAIYEGKDLKTISEISAHLDWATEFAKKYSFTDIESVKSAIEAEIGKVFVKVLENAGVFKCDETGRSAFRKFIKCLSA